MRRSGGTPEADRPAHVEVERSRRRSRLRGHLDDRLYRTGYYLIIGTGITSLLGVAFWALAARSYSAHEIGQNAAAISAMTLVSGVCSLGLSAVLIRYLPIAGTADRRLVWWSYGVTTILSLAFGALVAASSSVWSPTLSFLQEPAWLAGFTLATAATTIFTLEDSVLTGLGEARWIPLENSLYSAAKLVLLVALSAALPQSGPFVAWNAPLLPAIVLVNLLIFRRLLPRYKSFGELDRRKVINMAAGNWGGNLFALVGNMYLPILVANQVSAAQAAYFYVPWMVCISLQLVSINLIISLTVEAARDMRQLRQMTRRTFAHSMRLVAPLAVFTALIAPLALLVFGQAYADAGTTLLRLLAIGAIPNVFVALGIGVARIEHKGQWVALVDGAQVVILLGGSALLLPDVGIEAVGYTWAGSQVLLAGVLLVTILRPLLLSGRPIDEEPRPAA
jgi:O-antigen/teichoic acid export membrane protein